MPGDRGMAYIWVRETTDWADREAFLAQIPPRFEPKLELWNATFNLPYHVFRHRVREIAEINHSRVEGAAPADWDRIPEGALVLPVDDDDWFSPDIVANLERRLDSSATGCYWTASWVEVPTRLGHRLYLIRRRVLPWTPPKHICTTNNYAMVKDGENRPLLYSHMRASAWMKGPGAAGMRRLDERLSVTNRTLASQTTLRPLKTEISRAELLRKFRRYKSLYARSPPDELGWSKPYMAMMAELMDRLSLKAGRSA